MSAARIPLIVLTGFSGAGKTTLLEHVLSAREARGSIVIVNELGKASFGHPAQFVHEELAPSAGSCPCCSIRAELADALWTARWQAELCGGKVERVFLETSGFADPVPVLRAVMTDPYIASHHRLAAVVTVVDALDSCRASGHYEQMLQQVTAADLLVITHADLVRSPWHLHGLHRRLRRMNPLAWRIEAPHGFVEARALLALERRRIATTIPDAGFAASAAGSKALGVLSAGGTSYPRLAVLHGEGAAADRTLRTFTLERSEPLDEEAFGDWLGGLVETRGADVLRMKGVVHFRGQKSPQLVESFRHFRSETVVLPAWPPEDRRTRLAFITRGVDQHTIERSLETFFAKRRRPAIASSC
jgi:G3E family GTPase